MTGLRDPYRMAVRYSRRLWRFGVALAGELSDERAYARHLAACGRAHSADEWRRFSDERHRARFARAKCC